MLSYDLRFSSRSRTPASAFPEAAPKTLGRPFEQVEGQLAKTYQGSGLGLAIAKSLGQAAWRLDAHPFDRGRRYHRGCAHAAQQASRGEFERRGGQNFLNRPEIDRRRRCKATRQSIGGPILILPVVAKGKPTKVIHSRRRVEITSTSGIHIITQAIPGIKKIIYPQRRSLR